MPKPKIEIDKHELVPKHSKVSDREKQSIFKKYNITLKDLPRIKKEDPALEGMDLQQGDIVKIVRTSPTATTTVFYRTVM